MTEEVFKTSAKWTKRLIIIIGAIYLLQVLSKSLIGPNWAVFMFGLHSPAVANGDWWRLITATFLHGSLLHLGFNLLALWILGTQVEIYLGSKNSLLLYLVSAMGDR